MATALTRAGLVRGDRVAGLLSKQPEAYVTALAAWRAGMIYVPLFVGLGSEALIHRATMANPRLIVVDAAHRAAWDCAAAALSDPPQVCTTGGPRDPGSPHDIDLWNICTRPNGTATGAGSQPAVHTAADEPATLMFTSGTTGAPKGCVIPHGGLLGARPFVESCLALGDDDVLFSGADPGWSYGLYTIGFAVLATGRPIVVQCGPFDPQRWLRVFAEESITYVGAAPSALRRLVSVAASTGGLPKTIRGATSSGEPLDAALVRAWSALCGGEIRDGYGQTEAGMLLANLAYGSSVVPGALNSVVPGFDVVLLPEAGGEEPLTGVAAGVIAVRRPRYQASIGYWNEPEKWAARWRGDFFLTGDIARRDDAGRFWFIGRGDDLIVTSGYNVGPNEVENIILADPDVAEAAVVAEPDAARGSVVRAVVVVVPGADPDTVKLRIQERVRDGLGRHAYPRIVDFVAALPRTATGKIRRSALRQSVVGPPAPANPTEGQL